MMGELSLLMGVQVVVRDGIVAYGETTASTTLTAGLHSN